MPTAALGCLSPRQLRVTERVAYSVCRPLAISARRPYIPSSIRASAARDGASRTTVATCPTLPLFATVRERPARCLDRLHRLNPNFVDQRFENVFQHRAKARTADREVQIVEVDRAPAALACLRALSAVPAVAHHRFEQHTPRDPGEAHLPVERRLGWAGHPAAVAARAVVCRRGNVSAQMPTIAAWASWAHS